MLISGCLLLGWAAAARASGPFEPRSVELNVAPHPYLLNNPPAADGGASGWANANAAMQKSFNESRARDQAEFDQGREVLQRSIDDQQQEMQQSVVRAEQVAEQNRAEAKAKQEAQQAESQQEAAQQSQRAAEARKQGFAREYAQADAAMEEGDRILTNAGLASGWSTNRVTVADAQREIRDAFPASRPAEPRYIPEEVIELANRAAVGAAGSGDDFTQVSRTPTVAEEEASARRETELFWKQATNRVNDEWDKQQKAETEWREYYKAGVVTWDNKPSNVGSVDAWNKVKGNVDLETNLEKLRKH